MSNSDRRRSKDNATLTISLAKTLTDRISDAALAEHRTVSNWCVVKLKDVLDALDAADETRPGKERRSVNYREIEEAPALRVADEPAKEEANGTE